MLESLDRITIVTSEESNADEFISAIRTEYERLKESHLIINLLKIAALSPEKILEFSSLSKEHKALNKSFVIVVAHMNYDAIPDELVVVPTIQEAQDMIEMESIERDLGL